MKYGVGLSLGLAVASLAVAAASAASMKTLQTFSYGQGADPTCIVQGPNGVLYGTLFYDGPAGDGAIFSFDPATRAFNNVHDFSGLDGSNPVGTLIAGANGVLYGATQAGGQNGLGVIYSFNAKTGTYTILHAMADGEANFIDAGLVADKEGNLYGTSDFGGPQGKGNVFKYETKSGSFSVLASFGKGRACYPAAALVIGKDGALYGTAGTCGASNGGTVFRLETSGGRVETVYNFPPYTLGMTTITAPTAALAVDPLGRLYGFASLGGAADSGGIFRIVPATRAYEVVHVFTAAESNGPSDTLTFDSAGRLMGTSFLGGANTHGTIFRLNPASKALDVLYSFPGNPTEGALGPATGLIPGPKGHSYGAAENPGNNSGAIYELK